MDFKKVPVNALDRAIKAMGKSQSALPDLMNRLVEGDLWFLVPYQNEIDGMRITLKEGMAAPFAMIKDGEGELVPIFSSAERAEEAMDAAKVKINTFALASMKGQLLLDVLGKLEVRTVLNKSCSTGELELPVNLMQDIGSGVAFEPEDEEGEESEHMVSFIDPADYPTALLQPLFEILKKHPSFRAAWIFDLGDQVLTPSGDRIYKIMLHMEPRNPAALHELNLVLATTREEYEVDLNCFNEEIPGYIDGIWQQVKPFYAAVGNNGPKKRK